MKLDKISTGSVYVDTNILYMYLRVDPNHIGTIKAFLEKVVSGQIEAFVGVPVLDELYYRLLLAQLRESAGRNPLDVLRDDVAGAIAAHGGVIETAMRKLVSLPNLNVVGVESTDFDRMMGNIRTFSLLPRDALHLAIIQRLGLAAIASDDRDFDRVEGITRYWVINPPLP